MQIGVTTVSDGKQSLASVCSCKLGKCARAADFPADTFRQSHTGAGHSRFCAEIRIALFGVP